MKLFLLTQLLLCSSATQAFNLQNPSPSRSRPVSASDPLTKLTSIDAATLWYPPIETNPYRFPEFEMPRLEVMDTVATLAASYILDNLPLQQDVATSSDEKQCHLSTESLTEILLKDITERNSLVTADFTQSIYDDACRFKDGSDLDGSYPMKPWILGCKMLFRGDKSKAEVVEDSLVVTPNHVSFRFQSALEFRGPFSPQVDLTGRIFMKRDPETGLISSYEEIWDKNVWDIVKEAKLQVA